VTGPGRPSPAGGESSRRNGRQDRSEEGTELTRVLEVEVYQNVMGGATGTGAAVFAGVDEEVQELVGELVERTALEVEQEEADTDADAGVEAFGPKSEPVNAQLEACDVELGVSDADAIDNGGPDGNENGDPDSSGNGGTDHNDQEMLRMLRKEARSYKFPGATSPNGSEAFVNGGPADIENGGPDTNGNGCPDTDQERTPRISSKEASQFHLGSTDENGSDAFMEGAVENGGSGGVLDSSTSDTVDTGGLDNGENEGTHHNEKGGDGSEASMEGMTEDGELDPLVKAFVDGLVDLTEDSIERERFAAQMEAAAVRVDALVTDTVSDETGTTDRGVSEAFMSGALGAAESHDHEEPDDR
jgi:hypothetical protein